MKTFESERSGSITKTTDDRNKPWFNHIAGQGVVRFTCKAYVCSVLTTIHGAVGSDFNYSFTLFTILAISNPYTKELQIQG
jgi:hypothetical protein